MKYLLTIILIIILLIGVYLIWPKPAIVDSNQYLEKIDSLENEIEYLQDIRSSTHERIDTIYQQIEKVKVNYETIRNNIISNSINDDYDFFTNYLNRRWGVDNE